MILVPMTESHVRAITPQPAQADLDLEERIRVAMAQAEHGPTYSVMRGERVFAIGGACLAWPGRFVAWTLLDESAGGSMVAVTRAVLRFLDSLDAQRIELYVDASFEPGRRWARLLGFRCETPEPMRWFMSNGNDAFLYARTLK